MKPPVKTLPKAARSSTTTPKDRLWWVNLLEVIPPESRFLGLAVLIIEMILAAALFRFESDAAKLNVVYAMSGLIALTVIVFAILTYKPPTRSSDNLIIPVRREGTVGDESEKTRFDYHVFVATAMAAIDDGGRVERTAGVQSVCDAICDCHKDKDVRVFYAGAKIQARDRFDDPAVALAKNIERMRASRYLALIYYENVPTSALLEVGMALSLGKNNVWFLKKDTPVPFLMTGHPIAGPHLPNIRIVYFRDEQDLLRLVVENCREYFPV